MKYSDWLGKTVHYTQPMGRNEVYRCTVWLLQPPNTCLAEVWPQGIPTAGLSKKVKRKRFTPSPQPHYVLKHERLDEEGNPKTPRYFVLGETRFETWVVGVGS